MLIGISCRVYENPTYKDTRDALSFDWSEFLRRLGEDIVPVIIPNNYEIAKRILAEFNFDGLILTNGNDIGDSIERDKVEKEILNHASIKEIPLLGICRGLQFILHSFGESIDKDIKSTSNESHVNQDHEVFLSSELRDLWSKDKITVNSFHNEGFIFDREMKEFDVIARSENNVVEAILHKSKPIFAVQWHPERKIPNQDIHLMHIYNFFKSKKLENQ